MKIENLESRQLLHAFSVNGSILTVTGTAGADTFAITSTDTSFTVFPFEGSVAETPETFQYSAITGLVFKLGDGNDKVSAEDVRVGMRMEGGGGRDTLLGGRAGDRLLGGGSADILHGNGGNDNLEGNAGPDRLFGEGGRDKVAYNGRSAAISVNLGVAGGDGEIGENDDLASDIETIIGTSFDDFIQAGGKRGYNFTGGAGVDTLVGGGGNDTFRGGSFPDSMVGNGGNDLFFANDDNNEGLLGTDQVFGGSGIDTVFASSFDELHDVESTQS